MAPLSPCITMCPLRPLLLACHSRTGPGLPTDANLRAASCLCRQELEQSDTGSACSRTWGNEPAERQEPAESSGNGAVPSAAGAVSKAL